MFERFTEQGRRVVVLAQDAALERIHSSIATEHILLGLLREDGLAARVLESAGITIERVVSHAALRAVAGERLSPGRLPFTDGATAILERAIREALSLGDTYAGPEHLLLALLRESESDGDGDGAHILLGFAADTQQLRAEVLRILG